MSWNRIMVLGLTAALFACDDDGSSGASTSPVEDPGTVMGGQATGERSAQLTTLQAGTDANGAQGPIASVGAAMQQWVGSFQAYNAQQMAASRSGLSSASRAMGDNEISFEDNHLSATVSYANGQTSIHYVVELDIVPTEPGHELDGTYEMAFSTTQIYEVSISYNAVYDALKLNADGCPVSGTISLDYSYDVGDVPNLPPEAAGQLEQSGSLEATYGPNCGDVAVAGDA